MAEWPLAPKRAFQAQPSGLAAGGRATADAPKGSRNTRVLSLRVTRRMLFIGSAVIPLHNISWVDAYMEKPNRSQAGAWALLFGFLVMFVSTALRPSSSNAAEFQQSGRVIATALIVGGLLYVFRRPKPALAIGTTGGSTVVLTLPTLEQLRTISRQIADTIENPEHGFSTLVQQFTTTNNHFGAVVNMIGGRGNKGISG